MRFKTIEYRFKRNSLQKVGRVSSFSLGNAKIIDHTFGAAAKQEPAIFFQKDMVLALGVRTQKKKDTDLVSFCFGSPCRGMKFKTIKYRFEQNSLQKVGRVSSFSLGNVKTIDHTFGAAAKQEPAIFFHKDMVLALG